MIPKPNVKRVLVATLIAVPACAAVAALMWFLPTWVALWFAIAGVVLFQIGAEIGWKWCAFLGGIVMFGSVFAWAIRQ